MYFYRLGHNRDLAHAEFESICDNDSYELDGQWLVSTCEYDAQKTGGIIFGGKVLTRCTDPHEHATIDALEAYQQSSGITKIGVAIVGKMQGKHIQFFKDAGFKKINMIHKIPTHGNLKHTRNWIVVFPFKGQLVFGAISSFANQQFWSNIDMNMPAQNMDRGMINLKLARCMLNLRSNNSSLTWDPLGGLGRNFVAGIDLVNQAWISDKDRECEQQAQDNIRFAKQYFDQKRVENNFILDKVFTHSIDNILSHELEGELKDSTVSIVTEGYLGHNLAKSYTEETFRKQLGSIETMWNQALTYWDSLSIEEIIFCLPFMKSKKGSQTLSPSLDIILEGSRYQAFTFPNGRSMIEYSRKNTVIGHGIIKLQLATN
jgi:hypothetical protein